MTATPGIVALFRTKPDQADEFEAFLQSAADAVVAETGTITWYAFRADETTFGVFDTFTGEDARQAHMSGAVAARLGEKAAEWLAGDPEIRFVDIIATK